MSLNAGARLLPPLEDTGESVLLELKLNLEKVCFSMNCVLQDAYSLDL